MFLSVFKIIIETPAPIKFTSRVSTFLMPHLGKSFKAWICISFSESQFSSSVSTVTVLTFDIPRNKISFPENKQNLFSDKTLWDLSFFWNCICYNKLWKFQYQCSIESVVKKTICFFFKCSSHLMKRRLNPPITESKNGTH